MDPGFPNALIIHDGSEVKRLVALVADLVLITITHMAATCVTAIYNPSPRESHGFLYPLQGPGTYAIHRQVLGEFPM